MPRNFNKYQYETSPRKLEPEYTPKKNPYKAKKSTAKKTTNKTQAKKQVKTVKKSKMIMYLILGFLTLFVISYRNSQINEEFAKVEDLKTSLGEVEKQNAQLELSIENSLNFSTIEQQAKELLGMQKQSNKQTVYVSLPKTDYIASATENVVIEEEGTLTRIINTITNIFK